MRWPPPPVTRAWASIEFRAMASPCRIVTDDAELAAAGRRLVDALEHRWSRFVASSEVSALNRAAGDVCVVSPETYRLVELAEAARSATDGLFNPLGLDRLEHLGAVPIAERARATGVRLPAPLTQEPIELYPEVPAVRLPPGSRFDPGGIGKGLAGDLVADHLCALGAGRAQIELGGDVRLVGSPWVLDDWSVEVSDSRERGRIVARLSMPSGAIATSSSTGEAWRRGDSGVHPLIDPATGLPPATGLLTVTTTADRLWWAEVVAKVALISGSDQAAAVLRRHRMNGLVVRRDGTVTVVDDTAERAA